MLVLVVAVYLFYIYLEHRQSKVSSKIPTGDIDVIIEIRPLTRQ